MAEASNRTVVPCKRYAKLLESDDNKREKTWASNIVLLRDDYTLQKSVDVLKNKIKETLAEITSKTGHAITEFTIGKTFARERKNTKFDPCKFSSWKNSEGIGHRWQNTYSEPLYNYDGVIALCGITKDIVPENVCRSLESVIKRDENKDDINRCQNNVQQYYALILEQRLIQYYMAESCDEKLGNSRLSPGSTADKPYAGVVYVAYKLPQSALAKPPCVVCNTPIRENQKQLMCTLCKSAFHKKCNTNISQREFKKIKEGTLDKSLCSNCDNTTKPTLTCIHRSIKPLCKTCSEIVRNRQQRLDCKKCYSTFHRKCSEDISQDDFREMKKKGILVDFVCKPCGGDNVVKANEGTETDGMNAYADQVRVQLKKELNDSSENTKQDEAKAMSRDFSGGDGGFNNELADGDDVNNVEFADVDDQSLPQRCSE